MTHIEFDPAQYFEINSYEDITSRPKFHPDLDPDIDKPIDMDNGRPPQVGISLQVCER